MADSGVTRTGCVVHELRIHKALSRHSSNNRPHLCLFSLRQLPPHLRIISPQDRKSHSTDKHRPSREPKPSSRTLPITQAPIFRKRIQSGLYRQPDDRSDVENDLDDGSSDPSKLGGEGLYDSDVDSDVGE